MYIIYSCYELGQAAFTPSMLYSLLVIMGVVHVHAVTDIASN